MARPKNGQDKQAEILAAALRIFREKGYHAASMQDLADEVGMQKGSLYYYVSSKEDLLTALYERFIGAFTAQLSAIVAEPLPPDEKLRRAIESHVVALSEQLELFHVYIHEQHFLNQRLRARIHDEAEHQAELLEAILAEGVRSGEFRAVDVTMTAHAIVGMCNWIYQWYSPEGKLNARDISAIFYNLVAQGVMSPYPLRGSSRKKSRPKVLKSQEA
ncbi:MAG: TetR/AcrR family transcriptional regulator [Anaerolineae bacterium]